MLNPDRVKKMRPKVAASRPSMAIAVAMMVVHMMGPNVVAEDPVQVLDWTVDYMDAYPLGVAQQVIAINGEFPGPQLEIITNMIIVINVQNNLDEPFLLTWNGIQQRKDGWQDGVLGTNCPIMPGQNWTYEFRAKDQIGSFSYFPSTHLQKVSGGFGSLRVNPRSVIASPFLAPADDFALLIGDWYKSNHKVLRTILDEGELLPAPDAVLINGYGPFSNTFDVEQGKTYRFRISNIGSTQTLNFRIQGHRLLLVETEGSYVQQTFYDSLDVHVGQSYSVLVTVDQNVSDYYLVASTRFTLPELNGIAVLHYTNSSTPASGELPAAPTDPDFSVEQARSIKWNLTAGGARPNPQGTFHYGQINITKTFIFANSAPIIFGRQRYAINNVSHFIPDTPLKLVDFFQIPDVFEVGSIPDSPAVGNPPVLTPAVLDGEFRSYIEIVFQNDEFTTQSWHMDGYAFWIVAMGTGVWNETMRSTYNLDDAVSRTTTQVYPNSWTVVLTELDNPGMWNIRSADLQRQYLGQELYMRILDAGASWKRQEQKPPLNLLLCGRAIGYPH